MEYAIVVIAPFPQPDDWARPSGAVELNSAQGAILSISFIFSSSFQIIPQSTFQIQIQLFQFL